MVKATERALKIIELIDHDAKLRPRVLATVAEEIRTAEHKSFLLGLEIAAKIAENLHKVLEPLASDILISEEVANQVCREVAENIRKKITTGPGPFG